MLDKLTPLRLKIDAIDARILALLSERGLVAQEVGRVKAETGAPVFRPEREVQVLRRIAEDNRGPLHDRDLQTIFREIMSSCRALEQRVKVAYLDAAGGLGKRAVSAQFGSAVDGLPCVSIDEVFRAVEAGAADYGVVPAENAPEGAIKRTLDLLLTTTCIIGGEITIPLHYSLMSASASMNEVKVVYADAQALLQCQAWLNLHCPHAARRTVASPMEAAMLASRDPAGAAITSEMTGEQYALRLAQAHIQDDPHERSRFLLIGRQAAGRSGRDRTSLVMAVPDKAGAVYELLAQLARHGVSMTRFESRPARGGPWKYHFHVDIDGHVADAAVHDALEAVRQHAGFFKILGSYPASL